MILRNNLLLSPLVSCGRLSLLTLLHRQEAGVPTTVPIRVIRDCPVVGHQVLLSRYRVFLDYVLVSESAPTCSNIHTCLGNYGYVKNIPECLLHSPSKHFPLEGDSDGKE
jgi:hypothetical protein